MMTTAPPTTTAVALVPRLSPKPPLAAARPAIRTAWPQARRSCVSCQVALTTEVPSSSLLAEEEAEAEAVAVALAKVGARVRVTEPVKVYHVSKAPAPELDLRGMEGTIKQYVGVWKGKCISANLPFKVEFLLPVNGEPKPVKFFAHLKDDEFECLPSSD